MKTIAAFLVVLCHLSIGHAWTCSAGPRLSYAVQIDAGQGKVVATDRYARSYFLSGSSWYRLPSTARIQHVTVGHGGLWATSTGTTVYKLVAGEWARAPGLLKQVDAGGYLYVVGVNRAYTSYCLRSRDTLGYSGIGSIYWRAIRRLMIYYSCGPYGCWGVDRSYRVYVAMYVRASDCYTTRWMLISGLSFRMIEVGSDGSVVGVTTSGRVYQRTGISSSRPQGLSWLYVPIRATMRHVSYDLKKIWGVTTSGHVIRCTN